MTKCGVQKIKFQTGNKKSLSRSIVILDKMNNFFDSMINTINKIDGGEEYLTFFAMCVDNLSLGEFSSLLSGDVFAHYEEDYENEVNTDNHLRELVQMSNEDVNILKINNDESDDIEIVEYLHLDEYLQDKLNVNDLNMKYLDKTTIIHNLISLSKLENNQKLWLYKNIKKIDISNGYYIVRWLMGQSRLKIIPCVVLTVQSALQEQMMADDEIKKYLYESMNGLENLIRMYPDNDDLINLRILIKSKF